MFRLRRRREAHVAPPDDGRDDGPVLPETPPESDFVPLPAPPRFEERCQGVNGSSICGHWSDQFCLRCTLQVCNHCRGEHILLVWRFGVLTPMICNRRSIRFAGRADVWG